MKIPKKTTERWKRGVRGVKQAELQNYLSPVPKEEKKYTQDWKAYNEAQSKEKLSIMAILDELLLHVPFPTHKNGVGRTPIQLRDVIFYAVLQAYNIKSSRRCISDIEIARRYDYVTHTPQFNTVLKYLSDPRLTVYLKHLITLSGLPLTDIEHDFAIDSSGFSTKQYACWFDIRYTRKKDINIRQWMKAHICVGTISNIITAANITSGRAGDNPQFENLLEQTNQVYTIQEVSADKAYNSRSSAQAVLNCGGIPYIPFRTHVTGKRRGTCMAWRTLFDHYHKNREDFDKHYHKRSNVEVTNHMLKTKFGSYLRSKKDTSKTNEILAKCLCHNLCVLNQEALELGISLDFEKCAEIPIAHK